MTVETRKAVYQNNSRELVLRRQSLGGMVLHRQRFLGWIIWSYFSQEL
jgi:hypothetical protein